MRAIAFTGLGLLVVSLFYLATGVVYEEGGFGVSLVLKPSPDVGWAFGGGEEGAWRRHNPYGPEPWWLSDRLDRLIYDSWEEGTPAWLLAYSIGLLAVPVVWVGWSATAIWRVMRRRSASRAVPHRFEA